MWCDNPRCHYGSMNAKFKNGRCPQCGNKEFEDKSPFPKKPLRSIRAMNKRVNAVVDTKSKETISEDVAEIIAEAKNNK